MIIVTGVGSCGSSMIAGILHYLGVNMGTDFDKGDLRNPWGYFEDKEFSKVNNAQILDPVCEQKFLFRILEIAGGRREPWGVKGVAISNVIRLYRIAFPNARWVWARRDRNAIIHSLKKNWGDQIKDAEIFYKIRYGYLYRYLPGIAYQAWYESFSERPREEILHLVHAMGLDPTPGQLDQAVDFVKDEYEKREAREKLLSKKPVDGE